MTKSYIHIGEDIVDASTVTKPNNKDFRDAWQLNRKRRRLARELEAATTPEELTAAWPLDLEKPL